MNYFIFKSKIFVVFLLFINSTFAQFGDYNIIDPQTHGNMEVCTGDINNDGLQDIILAKAYASMELSYYLNLGNGNFDEEQFIDNGVYSTSYFEVTTADLNSDGFDDIATMFKDTGNNYRIGYFLNDNGSFGEPVFLDSNLFAFAEIRCADIDNDNDIDIIGDDDISIKVYKNDGNGNFSPPDIIASSSEYYDFNYADFNGDGFVDIITVSEDINIYWNDTNGNFVDYSTYDQGYGLIFLVTPGDFDNDNDIDFVVWNASGYSLVRFSNDGTGVFTEEQEIANINMNLTLETSDVDLDGDTDILTATNQESSIIWFENDGNGNFSDENIIHQFEEFHSIKSIYPSDLDNDGDEEVIWVAYWAPLAYNENTTTAVSVNENIVNNTVIQLYPNPTNDRIIIKSNEEILRIQVYNNIGQAITEEKVGKYDFLLNTEEYYQGVIFLQISTDNNTYLKKIIKK